MSRWTELLDRLVARELAPGEEEPPHVRSLRLPYPSAWEPGRVAAEWQVDPRFFQERGALFGGFVAALADQLLGMATLSVLDHDEVFTTSDLRTSFFRPIEGGVLRIEAVVVHRGRSMVHAEVTFTRSDGKLAAKATATQVVSRA